MDRLYKGEYEVFRAIIKDKIGLGVSESFKKIITENYNDPKLHILEDDVVFLNDKSREYFEEQYNNLPSDWLIYLGGSYSYRIENDLGGLLKIKDYRTFNSVVIKKEAYDYFLSHDHKKVPHIDHWVSNCTGLAYLCNPMVVKETGGYSYNKREVVDYSHFLKGKKLYEQDIG